MLAAVSNRSRSTSAVAGAGLGSQRPVTNMPRGPQGRFITFTAPGDANFSLYIGRYYGGNGYRWNGALDGVLFIFITAPSQPPSLVNFLVRIFCTDIDSPGKAAYNLKD